MNTSTELIRAYVPEAEYISYDDALALAVERDRQAADQLRISCEDAGLKPRQ